MNFSFTFSETHATTIENLGNISGNYSAGNMITVGVAIVVLVAIICAILFIVWGGVMLILSGGKDEKVKPAINSIRYSVIGLIVIVIALFVTPKVVEFMGLENMKQYLGPDVIFRSIKDIANSIFSDQKDTDYDANPPSLGTDFTDL